jgi:trypsin-like peptidase
VKTDESSEDRPRKGPTLGAYSYFSPCIAGLVTEDSSGAEGIGTAFHIGDGYLVTARHVVEDRKIIDLLTHVHASVTIDSIRLIYPSDPNIDLALLCTDFSLDYYMNRTRIIISGQEAEKVDHLQLGGHLDDFIDDGLILLPIIVFGYPPIPLSSQPVLVAARGEINAVVDTYIGSPHPLFVISPLARAGFSGGPVILGESYVLGVVTSSLLRDDATAEVGFHAALTVEPIWNLLFEHRIFPASNGLMMYEMRFAYGFEDRDFPPHCVRANRPKALHSQCYSFRCVYCSAALH